MMGDRFGEAGFRRHTCFAGDPASTPFCPMLLFFGAAPAIKGRRGPPA